MYGYSFLLNSVCGRLVRVQIPYKYVLKCLGVGNVQCLGLKDISAENMVLCSTYSAKSGEFEHSTVSFHHL